MINYFDINFLLAGFVHLPTFKYTVFPHIHILFMLQFRDKCFHEVLYIVWVQLTMVVFGTVQEHLSK